MNRADKHSPPPHFNIEEPGHLRTPPHSAEAEQAVIGALLIDNNTFDTIGGAVAAEHFFVAEYRAIFITISALLSASKLADVLTVGDHGKHSFDTLVSLANGIGSPRSAGRYALIVRDNWAKRQIIHSAHDAIEAAYDSKVDAAAAAVNAQEALAKIAQGQSASEPKLIGSLMAAHIDKIVARGEGADAFDPTGLIDFDKVLSGGLRPGHLIVIAARPSMGKTTIALSIARNIAQRKHVLVLSQEMTVEQLLDANVAALGHIELDKVMRPDPNDSETWSRVLEGADRAGKLLLSLDSTPSMRVIDVRSKILNARRKNGGLAVVVIDYLQLMKGEGGENRNNELDQIVNGVKSLALELGICIIALAQCNREADKKPEGADSMSDIRDSGAIEAAGDVVAMLHREFVRTNDPKLADYGQLRIVKNRFGPTTRINLFFNGAYQFFGSWAGPAPTSSGRASAGARKPDEWS